MYKARVGVIQCSACMCQRVLNVTSVCVCVCGMQAGESNLRTLDKRETSNTNTAQQSMVEMELRMRDMSAEMTRFKRQVETDVRGMVDGMRAELRQREGVIQQLDSVTRGLALQVYACAHDYVCMCS